MAEHGREAATREGLLERTATALKWNYAGVLVRAICQLAIGIVLARLLGPGPFGIVAIAWLLIGACNLFADFGFASALVQRTDIADRDVHFVFTCQLALGIFLTLCGWLAADAAASYFGQRDAAPSLRAMFLIFTFQAAGQTSSALLRRALDFRNLQRISIGSYLLGYLGLGIPMAVAGVGVWALVAAYLAQSLLATIALIVCASIRPGIALRPASPGLLKFGGKVVAANLSSWAISNLDGLVVARMFGVRDLGLYNRAMTLVASPTNSIVSGLQGVLFSVCSRIQNQPANLKRAYLGASAAVAIACLPPFVCIAVAADTVAVGLYGAEWADAAAALRPLALAMPLTALLALAGPILTALDKVADEVKAQGLTLLVLVPLLLASAQQSIGTVGWAMLAMYLLRWSLLARAVLGAIGTSWIEMLDGLKLPVIVTAAVAAPVWIADSLATSGGMSASLRLALVCMVGATAMLTSLRMVGSRLIDGELGAFLRSRGQLPRVLVRLLNVKA